MHWDGVKWDGQRGPGDLQAVWGRARDDVWINGCANNFFHWNGTSWNRAPNPIPADYAGVCLKLWGTSATDVSAIGYDRFLRWNGVTWRNDINPIKGADPIAPGARMSALGGAPGSGDLWAVGEEGARVQFDGAPVVLRRRAGRWTRLPAPGTQGSLLSLWGDRDDNVWAVGMNGSILHWDGATWSQEDSGVVEHLLSIHGAGGTAWIVGDRGTMLVRSYDAAAAGPRPPPSERRDSGVNDDR